MQVAAFPITISAPSSAAPSDPLRKVVWALGGLLAGGLAVAWGQGVGAGKILVGVEAPLSGLLGTNAAHNEYLPIGVEGGIVGLGLLAGFFLLWAWRHRHVLRGPDRWVMPYSAARLRGAFHDRQHPDCYRIQSVACFGRGGVRAPRGRGSNRWRTDRNDMTYFVRLFLFFLVAIPLAVSTPAWAGGVAYVLNSGAASISVVDMDTRTEIRRIPVLREPHHVVATPDGKELLVGDSSGNEMFVLDPIAGVVKRRLPIANPYHLGFSPNTKFLVVNGLARGQVDIYDAATYKLIKRFPLKSMPSHLAYAPDSSRVFVTLQGTDQLAAIDLNRLEVLWVERVGKTPAGVIWHNGRLLVANMGSDDVVVINPANGQVERRIKVGRGTHQVFPSPDGKLLWVNSRVDGATTALDAKTLNIIRSYKVSGGPDCLDFAPDGKLWITRRFAERVAVLDPVTGTYENILVGRSPHGIFLSPNAVAR